jgi:acyl CoA:acetate/3-ketoacid CoA transferase alpha subunit
MSAKSKVFASCADAVSDIQDGAMLGFGGFVVVGMLINLSAAVAKQGARGPTCVLYRLATDKSPRTPRYP